MKRLTPLFISVIILAVIIALIIISKSTSNNNSAENRDKVESKRPVRHEISGKDKERIEKISMAIKQVKALPFNIREDQVKEKKSGDTGSIIGIVNDHDGKPIKGCIITLSQKGQPFTSARKTDLSGKFFFDKIETGEYKARIVCGDFRMEREGIIVEKDKITNLDIYAEKNEQIATGTISGNIIDFSTRNPIEGASVEFSGKKEKSSQITTDNIGRFSMNVSFPQSGKIIINKEGYIRKEINIEINEREISLNNIPLVAGNIKNEGSKYQGIGAALIEKEGEFVVDHVFEGTPAAKAGLMKNDRIIQINGMDISSLRLDELIALIRGDERTNVIITIRRGDTTQNLQIVRDIIEIK